MHLQFTLRKDPCTVPQFMRVPGDGLRRWGGRAHGWVTTVSARQLMWSRILNLDMIRILGTIFAGLLGLAFGSFLNVCLSRWPAGESVVQAALALPPVRSHARLVGERAAGGSWLALRGRCRTCQEPGLGWRYPLVEAGGALGKAFALGVILGAAAAIVLLAVPSAKVDGKGWALTKLPLGTFLCVGGIISGLWGQRILAGYLRWAGF
jgi:prepilin signal peptidase PulO-like enzyme (type II secretory pathway)